MHYTNTLLPTTHSMIQKFRLNIKKIPPGVRDFAQKRKKASKSTQKALQLVNERIRELGDYGILDAEFRILVLLA